MMTDSEKKEIVELIYKEIKKLEDKISELKEFTKPVSPDNAIGRISRMDAINNKSIFDAGMRNAEERLKMLEQILQIKDKPEFGQCIKCKGDIPLGRIKVRPEVRFCARCFQRH